MLSLKRYENIDFKLLFISVIIISILCFAAISIYKNKIIILYTAAFAFSFYTVCFLVWHRIAAMFYFVALFIGIYSYEITFLGKVMLSDVLFIGLLLSFLASNNINKRDICSPIFISLLVFCGFSIFSGLVGIPFMQDHAKDAQFEEVKTKYIAALYIFRFMQLPVIYLFVIDSMKKNNAVKNIIIFCILSQMLIVLFQIFLFSDSPSSSSSKLNASANGTLERHHMFIALYMMTAIPLFIGYAKEKRGIILKIFWTFIAFYAVYIIVISAARSVLLGLIVSFATFILLNIRFNKKSAAIIAFSIILPILVYKFTPIHDVFDRTFGQSNQYSGGLDGSAFSRFFIWLGTLNTFLNSSLPHKFIGNGPGSFAGLDLGIVIWKGSTFSSGAHNNFLHVLIETGIIGLIIFIAHFTIIISKLIKNKTFLSIVFICATIGLLASGVPQETFWMQSNYWMYYVTILGIVVGEAEKTNAKIC
jgi:hypothetical protein